MKSPLIKNFTMIDVTVDGQTKQGLTLDFENSDAFEKNVFIGLMRGRIPLVDCFSAHFYFKNPNDERDAALYASAMWGQERVIEDYAQSHEEAHLLFKNANVVIVFDEKDLLTRSAVMRVNDSGMIELDPKYRECDSKSKGYINNAGLETIIKKLMTDYPERLVELKSLFEERFDFDLEKITQEPENSIAKSIDELQNTVVKY